MHVGTMVTSYNQRDWDRLLAEDYTKPPVKSDIDILDNTIMLGDMVEPLGYDSIWCAEHYGSAYSMQSNPLQWLAFWAGRTERIDVGSAVIVAPWWQPVKLAHEIAMLDNMLQGRTFHIGMGRGIAAHEYAAFGINREESRGRFKEMFHILKGFDDNEFFEFHGEYYDIPLSSVRPQARHKGHLFDNVKAAFNTPASMTAAAELGVGQFFVAGENIPTMISQVAKFNAIRGTQSLPPTQPWMMCYLHCSNDPEEIEKGHYYVAQQSWASRNHYAIWNNPGQFQDVQGYEDYAKRYFQGEDFEEGDRRRISEGAELVGTPEQIYEKIQRIQEATSLELLLVHPAHGGKSGPEARSSLKLFAEEVLPAVHEMATPFHDHNKGTAADLLVETTMGGATG